MKRREVYEECMRFVSKMEGTASELDLAKEMGFEIDEDDLARAVIHRLRQAIKHVKKNPLEDDKARTLYHVALYAEAIGKPEFSIGLCQTVLNDATTSEEYQALANELLERVQRVVTEDIFNQELEKTVVDVDKALDQAHEWLSIQRKHATQPITKHVYNADLIKKSDDNAET